MLNPMLNGSISRLLPGEVDAYARHCIRQLKELSSDGGYAHPFSPDHRWDEEEYAQNALVWMTLPELSPRWQIVWKLEVEGNIVGHCYLQIPATVSEWHRVKLGMGIEEKYRGFGYGRALLATAVLWVRSQSRLSWIDLEVFETNQRAVQLYKRFGFEELAIISDAYRIKGTSVTKVLMTLKIQ